MMIHYIEPHDGLAPLCTFRRGQEAPNRAYLELNATNHVLSTGSVFSIHEDTVDRSDTSFRWYVHPRVRKVALKRIVSNIMPAMLTLLDKVDIYLMGGKYHMTPTPEARELSDWIQTQYMKQSSYGYAVDRCFPSPEVFCKGKMPIIKSMIARGKDATSIASRLLAAENSNRTRFDFSKTMLIAYLQCEEF